VLQLGQGFRVRLGLVSMFVFLTYSVKFYVTDSAIY